MLRISALILLLAAVPADVPGLVKSALGEGIVPYAGVKPVTADFDGDGRPDLAVVVDINKKLVGWLKRGTVILDLDSPSLPPLHADNEQHFCFGLLILKQQQPAQKTLFYGCFTGWRLVPGTKAALDLDMDSGAVLRLFSDGTRYRTKVVLKGR